MENSLMPYEMELNTVKKSRPLKFDLLGTLKDKTNYKGQV